MKNRSIRILVILVAILALGACGKSGTKSGGQVVAKVNGEEITIHQVNAAMARLGRLDEAQAKTASQQILNGLVDQQLLLKKAVDTKLDRDPAVMQTLEAAKRQILAQAYLEKQMLGLSKPSAGEVHDYYVQHPALFEKRRIYRFQELLLENSNAEAVKAAKEQLNQGKSMRDLAQWLQSVKIPFKANETVKPAEQLPPELLERVQALKVGQVGMVSTDKGALVMSLVATQDQPVTEAQGQRAIESYLTNKKRSDFAQAEIKKMHDTAKIEYLGAFADAGKLTKLTTPAAKAGDVSAQPTPATAAKSDKDALEKGLSGLR